MKVPMYKVEFSDRALKEVVDVITSGRLAQGEVVARLEEKFAKFVGCDYCVATANGSLALTASLMASGQYTSCSTHKEVYTPRNSFFASASSSVLAGFKPRFEGTVTRPKIALFVDLYGRSVPLGLLSRSVPVWKGYYPRWVVEDACQAHGLWALGLREGVVANATCFSFYPTKLVASAEGGVICSDDVQFADGARLIRQQGSRERYKHEVMGYNFRMNELQAVLALDSLKMAKERAKKTLANAKFYNKCFGLETELLHCYSVYRVKFWSREARDKCQAFLAGVGVESDVVYPMLVSDQKAFGGAGLNTSAECSHKLAIPVGWHVGGGERAFVVESVESVGGVV